MNARPPAWIGPRGVVAFAVLALVAGFACAVVAWPIVVIAVALLSITALVLDAATLATPPEILRTVPAHFMLARHDHFTYTLRNRAPVAVRYAIFEAPAQRLEIAAAPARGTLGIAERAGATVSFIPRERGRTTVGVAAAWYESRLGFVRRRLLVGSPTPVRIRPDLAAIERAGDLVQRTRLIDAGLRRIRRRGAGSEFESLREYTPDDPFRAIDWKATARRGKVMVAQYEVERSQQIIVAIDAGRLMAARLGDRRKLDYAVSAALALAALARQAADRVGLHAFAATTLAAIGPRSGAQQAAVLSDALSDLEAHMQESDYERAALTLRDRYRKRSLIVVFSDLFDPVSSGAVLGSLALLAPHHLVLLVLVNDAELSNALDRAPTTAGDVYRAGVATLLVAERARAVTQLRARGIGVVDVAAPDLTLALLDAYVDIKTRARL